MVGESMIYGKGAGSLPTGSAVMSDILDIAFDIHTHQSRRNLETNITTASVISILEQETQYYFRISLKNETGSLENMSHLFKEHNINIQKIIQKEIINNQAEVVIITNKNKEKNIESLKNSLNSSKSIIAIESAIRVGL